MPTCCICLEEDAEVLPLRECGHPYHTVCITKHFKQECPTCRREVTSVTMTGSRPTVTPIESMSLDELGDDDIVDPSSHYYAEEDNEFLKEIRDKLRRGESVSAEEMYQMKVAFRRARCRDHTITSLSDDSDEDDDSG